MNVSLRIPLNFGFYLAFLLMLFAVPFTQGAPKLIEDEKANNSLNAEVEITDATNKVNVGEHFRIVRLGAEVQLSDIKRFQNWDSSYSASPLQDNQVLWGNVKIKNHNAPSSRYTFVIGNPNLDFVDIYMLDAQGRILQSVMTGSKRPLGNRPFVFREFVIAFDFHPQEEVEFYFRIKEDGPLVFTTTLWKSTALIAKEQLNLTFIGVFTGALAVLACYFLVTYVLLLSPVRFWFAVSNMIFVLLFLNVEGILGQLTGQTAIMSTTTTVLLALAIFCAAKVSHAMLHKVPTLWRYATYFGAIVMLIGSALLNTYWQIELSAVIGALVVLIHLFLAIRYRNPFNSLPNKIYAAGWATISTVVFLYTYWFLQGSLLTTSDNLQLSTLMMMGVLLIGVSVEAHEKVLIHNKQEEQSNAISDLRRFYDFYRNSAEGLFTANYDGQLITVNPAMCKLFGYADEYTMLQHVASVRNLFANQQELSLLLEQLAKEENAIGREIRGLRHDNNEFWLSISVQLCEDGGKHLLFGSVVDITERKQTHISLAYLATHDPLTGVYNRRHFETELTDAMSDLCQSGGDMTLLYLDLDKFKAVNDTCGHKAGDMLLKELAQKLYSQVGSKGLLGRMGGDEFAILLTGNNAQLAESLAAELMQLIQLHRFVWENRPFSLGASIGLVNYHSGISSPEQMLSMADSACYVAKEQGRNQIHCYSSDDEHMQRYEMELNWLSHINEALEVGNFVLYFQPYQPLRKVAEGYHYELLLRIRDEHGNVTLPGSFLPAAERYKLIAKIDRWVIENYFKWLSQHPEHMQELVRCNINLSGQSLADNELKLFILDAFERYQIPYNKICFEITESMAIVRLEDTLAFMATFHEKGCKFALDDFGVGFSSYEYLKKLPVDLVKIDGSFVKNILNDAIDMAMVRSMRDVALAMGMETVAEYVESTDVMVELGKIGVDYAQGYGVAEPRPLNELEG
ncbi:EAL domain-containing protein [Paraneptunicella aestuarii]|uniref:EAL domain-containing protein n=1 Tax=Paraneptunicella aestuarii TaxID=2831148 RepID=UPI001E4FF855|nr:EAL domain-containing protein [Paraneptunicella aestuarii]